MKRYIDLHLHSTFSDGVLTPVGLVEHAKKRGILCISLTDHDNIGGIEGALEAGRRCGVEVIPGVELSAEYQPGTMHLLGYFIDHRGERLAGTLKEIQEERERRNRRIVEKFNELGVPLTFEEVLKEAGEDQIGRPHFARALIKKGAVKNFQEAFDKYLAKGRPAYFNRKRLSSRESIDLIHQAGGLAVLAHPKELRVPNYEETDEIVRRLVYEGLEGLEVYSSAHDKKDAREYLKIARRHRLFVTGGSDFHGDKKSSIELGILGDRRLDDSVVREMKERLKRP